MLSLKGRQDQFRLLLPDDLIPEQINEKYTKILVDRHSFITKPIDFLSETIKGIQVLGFNNGTVQQPQQMSGASILYNGVQKYDDRNEFAHPHSDFNYRTAQNPVGLMDKTLNIDFRHTLGYINYFMIFETFFYQNSRDIEYKSLPTQFNVDIFNEGGEIYSRVVMFDPLLDGLDMLDLDFTQPVAQSSTFRAVFKYSNVDFQFISQDYVTTQKQNNPPPQTPLIDGQIIL